MKVKPEHLLIDGNRFTPYPGLKHTTVVKGDGKYLSIAAASILAKTYRDDYMDSLDREYPAYHWKENKGYPTKAHREAIRNAGNPLSSQDIYFAAGTVGVEVLTEFLFLFLFDQHDDRIGIFFQFGGDFFQFTF